MMQPMNYTINAGNPGASFMEGANQMAQFANNQATVQANQQKAEAQRIANERVQYQQKRFSELAQNPDPRAVQKFMLEFPEVTEQFKVSYQQLNEREKEEATKVQYMVSTAIQQGKPEIAVQQLDRMIEAAKNSGDAVNLNRLEMERDLVLASPEGAQLSANGFLFSNWGPDKYGAYVKSMGEEKRADQLQPSKVKEAESKAESAAVAARFAEDVAVVDLQKRGWDINKIQNDIQVSRQNVAIAAQNAAINRADSETKKQEAQIKLQELIDKRSTTVREKVAEVENARAGIDNFMNTADRILNTPMGVVGAAAGPTSARLPTMFQSTADFEALVENIEAQSFIAQIPNMKGMGALSDAEGKKLSAALQNFSLKQSPERLLENVREAQRIMMVSRKRLADKYGVPDTVPDTPAAAKGAGGKSPDDILRELGIQ